MCSTHRRFAQQFLESLLSQIFQLEVLILLANFAKGTQDVWRDLPPRTAPPVHLTLGNLPFVAVFPLMNV